jgi:subtilisin family serine protease
MDRLVRPSFRRGVARRPLVAPEALERRAVLSVAPLATPLDEPVLPTALPNDPSFASQWSLENSGQTGGTPGVDINAERAWDLSTGSRSVVVAVIDSGIDLTHPDLLPNLWRNPGEIAGNGVDDDHNGFVDDVHGWDFIDNDGVPQDGYGHGTHVAGIIGAVGNDGFGVSGVSWQVSLMVLRIQNDSGVGSTNALLGAIQYATMMRRDFGVNVVVTNNSWEVGGYSATLEGLVREQAAAGITFVAAAGNHGTDNDVTPRYPGNFALPNVISVASLTATGTLAGSSDYGATTVDIAAPGTLVLSTWKGGGHVALSGTSMAAPQVSGVVALLAAAKPGITVAEVRAAILGTAVPLPALAGKVASGGRLDAFAALASLGVAAAPVPPPTVAPLPPAPPPVVVPPVVAPAATLPFFDGFDGTGQLASGWGVQAGGFTLSGGAAVAGSSGVSIATLRGATVADSVQRAVVNLRKGRSIGLVARYAGPGDQSMYVAQLARVGSGYKVQILRQTGGVWTLLAKHRVSSGRGELRFDVIGSQLTARFNGRIVAQAVDGQITAAGSVGLRAEGLGVRAETFAAS